MSAAYEILVAMGRVDLVEEDLAVEFAQEGLDQLEDALVELFTRYPVGLFFVDSHSALSSISIR